jgi:hypothetical protein
MMMSGRSHHFFNDLSSMLEFHHLSLNFIGYVCSKDDFFYCSSWIVQTPGPQVGSSFLMQLTIRRSSS